MSEPLNGHLELRDRRTGETVGLVVPQAEWTALRDQLDALTRQRDALQAELDRTQEESDFYRRAIQNELAKSVPMMTQEELLEIQQSGMTEEELREEFARICTEIQGGPG